MRLRGVNPADLEFLSLQLPPNFGLVLPVCRDLGIARVIDDACPMAWNGGLTHGQVIEAIVLHILQSVDRVPLYRVEEWAQAHNLGLLYDCPAEAFNDDRIGRALDALVPPEFAIGRPDESDEQASALPADVIEEQVVRQAISTYHIPVQAVHWDLTHITFTGAYDDAALIGPGYGMGAVHRKQIQMSLHASTDSGIPLYHRCLPSRAQQQPLAEEALALIVFAILGLLSERAGLSTEYYHKLTPREMLWRFGAIKMLLVRTRDGPPHCEIELTLEQAYLLHELGFAPHRAST